MWKRQKQNASSSSSEVDWCENIVKRIEEVLKRKKVLNHNQCRSLAEKLLVGIGCIREVVGCCEKHKPAFVPLLRALYRYYKKAEVLVTHCGDEEWCAAAVFQHGNTASFEDIIEHVSSLGMLTLWCRSQYACWMDISTLENTLKVNFGNHVSGDEDEEELRTRLEVLASERRNSSNAILGFFVPEQVDLKQYLARYVLKKTKIQHESRDPFSSLDFLEMYLWKKDDEPTRTWGESKFLGAGSGASGVCKTSWLGVPCAKKEFHGEAIKPTFMKEASIMARLKHPCIVDFVCCGNGEGKGDRFIAMELMEKSLFDLIEEQKGVPFALDVALDIILQIANGVKYLHEQGVAHRDLKPQNVVVKTLRLPYHNDYYYVKLVDFGTCKSEVEAAKSNIVSHKGVGTTRYRAPEVHPIDGLKKVEWFKADVYSFAMTCAHVLTLQQPYDNLKSLSELYSEILKGERPILPNICPMELVALMKECWETKKYQRPEFSTIYPRLKGILVNNMLVPFPNVIKKEQVEIKEEGDTIYYSAKDHSTYTYHSARDNFSHVVSQERECKSDVVEQVENASAKFTPPEAEDIGTSPKRSQGPAQQNLQLQFRNEVGLPLVAGSKVESEQGSAIDVVLQNANTGHVVTSGSDASAKMDIADMDWRFGVDGLLDANVESFLSHEEAGPRQSLFGSSNRSPAGHSMDVSRGFSFKEVTCLRPSTGNVVCCHFSSDGKLLASDGFDGRVNLWNMDTLKLKSSVHEHSYSITDVRFSPNSTRLATSSFDKTVRMWDGDDPNYSLRTFTGHHSGVESLDFHPNTVDLMCSCDLRSEIRYWCVNQRFCTRLFKGGSSQVRFQPRQGRLLAAAADNVASIFDVESGTCVRTLQRHMKPVHTVCWDATGDLLASVSEDSVRVWNLGSGGAQGECVHELSCKGKYFRSCVFHPNYPSLLVIGCYRSLELWNMVEKQSMMVPAHEENFFALASSAATGMVASASYDHGSHKNSVRLWK